MSAPEKAAAAVALLCALALFPAPADAQGAGALGDPRGPARQGMRPSATATTAPTTTAPTTTADEAADAEASHDASPEEHHERDVYLELQAFTHLPLFLGGQMAIEMGGHFVLRAGGGVAAGPYIDAINDVGTGWALWSSGDAQLLRSILGDAMFLEGGVALRTGGPTGLEVSASYALLWAHATLSPDTMSAMGAPPGTATSPVGLDLWVHAIHVEVAGVFLVGDPFPVRLAVGWMHALGRGATFAYDPNDAALDAMLPAAASAMESRIDSVGFGPTLSLAVGLRL